MALTKITGDNIQPGSITTVALAEGAGGGPKISNVSIANSSYTILDDTAIALEGGYLVITGTGFASGCQVVINSNNATSVTFVDSNTIRTQVGAADAGTKTVYVVNTDGGTAIRVNGLTYSATPTWVTGSTLSAAGVDEAISIQLDASLATSYQLQTGSSLPAGLSLAANGLLSGTVTGIEQETTYNFIVEAIDAENQESPRSFSITISSGDEYFYATTLLLNGDGTNGANNNTFVDSSTNNLAITRNGNVAQGTFTPFSKVDGRWGNYFNGSGSSALVAPAGSAFAYGTGAFTIEAWVNVYTYQAGLFAGSTLFSQTTSGQNYLHCTVGGSGEVSFTYGSGGGTSVVTSAGAVPLNTWTHIAYVRESTASNAFKIYVNGQLATTNTVNFDFTDTSYAPTIGNYTHNYTQVPFAGYISNFRVVKGSAVYTSNFTPSTTPLTAITNTSLLTCQSNRFKDNSTNNFTITGNGDVKVTSFSPFAPTGSYSAATNGGSGYFDGSGDYLSVPDNAAFTMGSGDFTIEFWVYTTTTNNQTAIMQIDSGGTTASLSFGVQINTSKWRGVLGSGSTFYTATASANAVANQWNHIAFVRNGNTGTLYINGTADGTVSLTGVSINDSNQTVAVGGQTGGSALLTGWIASCRVVKGTAVYTSAFTPPTAPLTAITNTSLLLNFTNAGIIDNSMSNNLETVGNAQIDTTTKKYGTGSMEFDGTGDYLSCPAFNAGLNPDSGDFTVEFWAYIPSLPGREEAIVATITTGGTGLLIGLGGGGNVNKMQFAIGNLSVGNPTVVDSSNFPTTTWTHVAAVRQSGTIYLYINGTSVGTPTSATGTINQPTLTVGNWPAGTAPFTGFIDDLRITKGIARYTSNFTPPDSAHRLR